MKNFIPLENLLGEFVSENHRGPSGCCCAVAKEGKTLYEGYFGYANREAGIISNPDTLYRMFSMTKIVTCTAAMMLFEQGKFLLNEPISDYLPEFKDMSVCKTLDNGKMVIEKAKQPILIKHAFTMSCGIGYPSDGTPTALALQKIISEFAGEGEFDLRTHLKAMATVPLAFEPGTRWLYGHGHDLIAGLIEVISGKSIGNFFHENIFDPLEMKNTDYRYHDGNDANMAVCYKIDDNTPKLIPSVGFLDANHQPDAIYEAGGAGLYSTLRDYLTFSQMLANGGVHKGERLIGKRTIDLMRTNHLSKQQLEDMYDEYLAGYGYGLGVRTILNQAEAHSYSTTGAFGWSGACGTWVEIDPDNRTSVVYLHNLFPDLAVYHHLRIRNVVNSCLYNES